MTLSALFGYSLLATVASSFVWVAVRVAWPRKASDDPIEMIPPGWEKRS